MVADLVHLNRYVKRPKHLFKCPRDILAMVDLKAGYFAMFDARSGYWQVMLDEESQALTTIITEWDLYQGWSTYDIPSLGRWVGFENRISLI